jgi:hypothetical protein
MTPEVAVANQMPPESRSVPVRGPGFVLRFAVILALSVGSPTWAANSVVVDSMTVQGGTQNVRIGIFLNNDVNLRNIVLPLTLRSLSGGAFITEMALMRNIDGRLDSTLTTINIINGYYADADTAIACKAATDTTGGFKNIAWSGTASHPVVEPPVACIFGLGLITPDEAPLGSGSDGLTPSLLITVDIGSSTGEFDVDTTCTAPSNHLLFVQDVINTPIVPEFTKGTITVTPTSVQSLGGDGIPRDYSLDQNYPNPFNAATVIKFNTKHDGDVRLDVFNILGQRVKTLVNEFRHYGPQAADWDGTDLAGQAVPTGLYFYRLVTSDYTDIKKMLLLK